MKSAAQKPRIKWSRLAQELPDIEEATFDSSTESSSGSESLNEENEIETVPSPDAEFIDFLYRPQLDSRSRELATLNSLLVLVQSMPGNGWLMYELYPNVGPYIFLNCVRDDGLRHSILSMAAIIRDMFKGRALSPLYL